MMGTMVQFGSIRKGPGETMQTRFIGKNATKMRAIHARMRFTTHKTGYGRA